MVSCDSSGGAADSKADSKTQKKKSITVYNEAEKGEASWVALLVAYSKNKAIVDSESP